MARPRKLAQDDRYVEESLSVYQEPRHFAEDPDEGDALQEVGMVSSHERFAALRDEDFGDNRS